MHLLSRLALGLLGLSFGSSLACQMENPAFDLGDASETRGTGDGDPSSESKTTTGDGDDTLAGDGDGDPSTGDGDPTTGDGDPTTGDGDGDPTTGDGDGDGDPSTGDGDGDGDPFCGNGMVEGDEECDDGNGIDLDACANNCTVNENDPFECMAVVDPENCMQCLNGECCDDAGLFCAGNMSCLCLLACLGNGNDEGLCMQMCGPDPNVFTKAVATLPCAVAHCPLLCVGS